MFVYISPGKEFSQQDEHGVLNESKAVHPFLPQAHGTPGCVLCLLLNGFTHLKPSPEPGLKGRELGSGPRGTQALDSPLVFLPWNLMLLGDYFTQSA